MICPLREIARWLHLIRPSGYPSDVSFDDASCIKEKCEWYDINKCKCSVAAEKEQRLNG